MPSERPWLRLMDILDNARSVLTYTEGMTYAEYLTNPLVRDGSERCLARISEAAVKLGPFAPDLLPKHDWTGIRGIGNLLRHDYDKLNIDKYGRSSNSSCNR